jgi:hypothetical protein
MQLKQTVTMMIVLALLSSSAIAEIYISEILYNPLVSESGGEAVELYNSGDMAINLSGYTVQTASSLSDAVLPSNAFIPAEGYYLIADASWGARKDSPLYPEADYEEAMTILNTDSGVALLDISKNTVDKVGWGNPSNINRSLYSGNPSNYTPNGYSLQRVSFTGDNLIDFISAVPTFENSKGQAKSSNASAIDFYFQINAPFDSITNITVNYDYENKILLQPKDERIVQIKFMTSNNAQNARVYLNSTQYLADNMGSFNGMDIYSVDIPLDFYTQSGAYNLTVYVDTINGEVSKSQTLEVLPMLAFEIDLALINCSLTSGQSCQVLGDEDMSTLDKPTIRNIGNVPLDFKAYALNFSNGSKNVDISYLKISFDGNEPTMPLHNAPELFNTNLGSGELELMPLSFLMQLPSTLTAGTFNTKILFLGVQDEG